MFLLFHYTVSATEERLRVKRQEDEGDADPTIEELCHDRPADEYFRLNTAGDCRDVVRYVLRGCELFFYIAV